uniref:MH2 domain-containing protein n=1 Tax=Elaeophora elaphi TaxID=1147741 RepID=A0A158Q8A0_9BILA
MRNECSLSRMEAACMAGIGRGRNGLDELRVLSSNNGTKSATDRWYTVEQFERECVIEILEKLEQGDLDDEIWGEIILMEKCKRLVKVYLREDKCEQQKLKLQFRRTAVIIDGSSDEYDGITLGFNHFENFDRDKDSSDIRHKIGDGVIVKIDGNGNVKAMARGLAPVIVQGWNDPRSKCIPEQLVAQKGHLKTIKDRLKGITDQQRVEKIFDMRLFNSSIEQELKRAQPNTLQLLLKSCIRIALVKDAGINALKTPCWILIVNLVALDVLRSKLPILRIIFYFSSLTFFIMKKLKKQTKWIYSKRYEFRGLIYLII